MSAALSFPLTRGWQGWVGPLSDTLLQLGWQITLLGLAAAGLLHLLRRQPPQLRYAVCAGALLLSLALAGLQLASQRPVPEGLALPAQPVAQAAAADAIPGAAPSLATVEALPDPWPRPAPWRQALVGAWLAGMVLMALRLGGGLLCLARWRQRSQPAPAAWQARLDTLARAMGLRRPVQLRLLPDASAVASPFTVGGWRPLVLLPASLLTGLPAPLLHALLAHELAHVRRWDYLVNLLQHLVELLLCFHPMVWWLSQRLRQERELVADALAAPHLDSPRQLALALHALAEHATQAGSGAAPALAPAATGGALLARVRALAGPAAPSTRPGAQALAALGALLMLALLALGLGLLPPATLQAVAAGMPGTASQAGQDKPEAATSSGATHRLATLTLASPRVLVRDARSGETLLARGAEQPVAVASLSKLMTALVVLQAGQDPQELLQLRPEDLREASHSSAGLRPGQRLSRADALALMLQASDNRAALLLASRYPGGRAAFERATEAQARALGLSQTSLRHPTGAPASNRASASDIARLLEAVAAQPLLARAAGSARLSVVVDGQVRESQHSIPLLDAPDWASTPITLAKTGYSQAAGRCVALQLRAGGRLLDVVLLGAPDAAQREADLQRLRDALQG